MPAAQHHSHAMLASQQPQYTASQLIGAIAFAIVPPLSFFLFFYLLN